MLGIIFLLLVMDANGQDQIHGTSLGLLLKANRDNPFPYALKLTRAALDEYMLADGSNVPVLVHANTYNWIAWFDAIAPYHETSVGIIAKVPRRPANESVTMRDKKIALLHASYHFVTSYFPKSADRAKKILVQALGPGALYKLDSDDMETPEGIGKYVGQSVAEAAHTDGLNSRGDYGGKEHNLKLYEDYTNYSSINSVNVLVDPTRWQPKLLNPMPGVLTSQQFMTPQYGLLTPFGKHNVENLNLPNPGRSVAGDEEYIRSTNEVINNLAQITDNQKAASEFFNDKLSVQTLPGIHMLIKTNSYDLDNSVYFATMLGIATHDALIKTWEQKRRFDAVRPFTAIKYVHGNSPIKGYVKGKGFVNNIRPDQWDSFINVADHPEYPSATSVVCGVGSEVTRLMFGTDNTFGFKLKLEKGKSRYEKGIPLKDEIVGPWKTWSDFDDDCSMSRVWSGLHFVDSVYEGMNLGKKFGKGAIDFVRQHINP